MSTAAILVAAGQSRRMGFDKLFAELGDRSVLAHSLQTFEDSPCIDEIIVVTSEERRPTIEAWAKDYQWKKLSHVVLGGRLRHLSVLEGLKMVASTTEYVAVHDGARPLLAESDWNGVVCLLRNIAPLLVRERSPTRSSGWMETIE